LHALLLDISGRPNVLALRAVGLVARMVLAVGLYALCRPLARPFFAFLPPLYVLIGLDTIPISWEPHPGWPAAALSIIAVLVFVRVPEIVGAWRPWWLMSVGALTALAFATKQNVGVFLGLGVTVCVLAPGTVVADFTVSPQLRSLQVALLGALAAAVVWLISPHVSPLLAGYFLGPIVFAGVVPLATGRVSSSGRRLGTGLADIGLLGIGFLVVSVPWLVALVVALNGQWEFLRGFVGVVNQDVLWHPLDLPKSEAWACAIGVSVALALAVWARRRLLGVIAALMALVFFVFASVLLTARPSDSLVQAVLWAPVRAADGLQGFVPLVAIVAAMGWCLRASPSLTRWRLGCISVVGALMLLAEYPRLDTVHLAWSAPLALVAGAAMLDRLHRQLSQRWRLRVSGHVVLWLALVLVPALTALPSVYQRTQALLAPPDHTRLATYSPVDGLDGVSAVLANENDQATLVAATRFAVQISEPGEPIFVYPSSPLIYVMADRPNPTRFEHLYPGAATPEQLRYIIATLKDVRVVVVNEAEMAFWGPPGANQSLETYLATRYRQMAVFGDYRVLMATG